MASRLRTIPLLLALPATPTTAMTPTNGVQFLFPTQGATLHYNDYVRVQYTSNFSAPWLFAFCRAADGAANEKQHQVAGAFNNTATVRLDWSGADTPCWFDLKPNSSAPVGSGANGDEWSFDVSQRAAATTVGLGSSSSSSSLLLSSGTSTSSPIPKSSPRQSSGLSTGAQAGIGIGAAIAGIFIGAAAVLVLMRRQRRRRARGTAAAMLEARHGNEESPGGAGEVYYVGGEQQQQQQQQSLQKTAATELEDGYPAAHELHGAPGLYEMDVRAQ